MKTFTLKNLLNFKALIISSTAQFIFLFSLSVSFNFIGSKSYAQIQPELKTLPGYKIELVAQDLDSPRTMALGTQGTLFFGTMGDSVYAIQKGRVFRIAKGLNMPNGVTFYKGALYVGEVHRILRFDQIEDHLESPMVPVVVYDGLPKETHHGWKYLAIGPDEKLYFQIGAPCNVCLSSDPVFATLARMDLDGSHFQVIANGIRNSVGFDWHPQTKELWFTENGRDNMGDEIPPCELNRLSKIGQHFGFPFCHGVDIKDPQFGGSRNCRDYTPPVYSFLAHTAPLGVRFYQGGMLFPNEAKNVLFVAEHGSWNRSTKVGYRVSLLKYDQNNQIIDYKPFITGFLASDKNTILGRPVDLITDRDGSLLISDDFGGKIWRVKKM